MKIAHYDETTQRLLGWYDKDIHTTIPTPNIEVSDEIWQEAINNHANFVDVENKTINIKDFRVDTEILIDAKKIKKSEMVTKFDEVSVEPVEVNGITYNGGFDSAFKLDGAKRLVELAGLTKVTFYDVTNKPNVLSIADANTVILTISAKVQSDFGHLQDLKVLIDSKLKVSTVEDVAW